MTISNLFFFGYGYVAQHLHQMLSPQIRVAGCKRSPLNHEFLYPFQAIPYEILDQFDHFLISIPPDDHGDVTLRYYSDYFTHRIVPIQWVGYLSASSVYGDQKGRWIDEKTVPAPTSPHGHQRLVAEQQWQETNLSLSIFRLAGIYGPGRCVIESVLTNRAQLIDKLGHVFNRIHVTDIGRLIMATLKTPAPLLNLADDCPAPLWKVYEYAHTLLNFPVPELTPYDKADLSLRMREFFSENKRIKNDLIKQILKDSLLYPTYKEGLDNCLQWHLKKSKKLT
ncbi:NAD-dependent epimerase/dehydratase family protein [Candidatus Odyssella acanthamoebae]|uniref:NAD-dependent epimerase/dehydratase family protein n=1 Tax=Candidatus Odyssella acanthamoebae TaxID=91604 RepID=UPI00056EA6E9|nr:NAD-dependent epimerase/dehydratase family protein [Candidatus Paracaedibacter acanthamoebae]